MVGCLLARFSFLHHPLYLRLKYLQFPLHVCLFRLVKKVGGPIIYSLNEALDVLLIHGCLPGSVRHSDPVLFEFIFLHVKKEVLLL